MPRKNPESYYLSLISTCHRALKLNSSATDLVPCANKQQDPNFSKCSSQTYLLSVNVSGGAEEEGIILCSAVKVLKIILRRTISEL